MSFYKKTSSLEMTVKLQRYIYWCLPTYLKRLCGFATWNKRDSHKKKHTYMKYLPNILSCTYCIDTYRYYPRSA